VVELKDGYIESIDARASGSGKSLSVSESVTLSYRECKIVYQPLNPETLRREGKTTEFRHQMEGVGT
jgi:type VI protein secretion system component Hcp